MTSNQSLRARQATSIASALLLMVVSTAAVAAQENPAATESTEAGPAELVGERAPGRLRAPEQPMGALGSSVLDVVEGGPGFIAVGGGTPTGLDHRALVWLSEDGESWQSVPLFGEVAVGTMRGVAALPDGSGYVAAGNDFEPEMERADMVHVLVWHSTDGYRWDRVPADASFPGSMVWDVTSTPDGVALAGCVASFHCDVGRVWTSADGFDWELTDEIAMAPYSIASSVGGDLLVGGEDDAYDLTGAQATVAASADEWTAKVLATPESRVGLVTAYGDGFLVGGHIFGLDGALEGTAIQASPDGIEWDRHEPKRLQRVAIFGGDAHDELVVVTGNDSKKGWGATALWGEDLETFKALQLPKSAKAGEVNFSSARITADGSRLFVFGSETGLPALWTTTLD